MVNKALSYFGIDFDGTCVMHEYPKVGPDCPGAVSVLKRLVDKGHKLCLNTMRDAEELQHAVKWFHDNGIRLFGINENKTQSKWTTSPKVYAHVYIDDAALGCPLVENVHARAYVDWGKVETLLEQSGYLDKVESEDQSGQSGGPYTYGD